MDHPKVFGNLLLLANSWNEGYIQSLSIYCMKKKNPFFMCNCFEISTLLVCELSSFILDYDFSTAIFILVCFFFPMGIVLWISVPFQLTLGKQQKVQVVTFGQPRIGNAVFASYYSEVVPDTFRVTHGNDMVPHLPPYYSYFPQKTYHHFPREVMVCFRVSVS